jgi:uracil-DNA glycosylase
MIIGEVWGDKKEPFVGPSGWLLNNLLSRAGLSRKECYLTCVFNLRPPGSNDVQALCGSKAAALPGYPALIKGQFVNYAYAAELDRLKFEIKTVAPNVIIALGATAVWALKIGNGIKKLRGTPHYTHITGNPVKVIPTYSPTAVMREYSLFMIAVRDIVKAKEQSLFPEIRRPQRFIHIEPNLQDLYDFERDYIDTSDELSIDIETANLQMTCIGFAPTIDRALVLPFFNGSTSYWKSALEEAEALRWTKKQCAKRKTHIVGQNFLYDLNYLWTKYGIPVPWFSDDTMLLHHALQPEMEKGLGFLGSIYTEEPSWKFMRNKDTLKQQDE